jgi:sulfite exporter TauE/SafE
MHFAGVHSPATAFVAGLVVSLHCAGMCGPLACWLMPAAAKDDKTTLYAVYQGTRLFSYGLLGAIAGLAGQVPLSFVTESSLRYLPWTAVVFFVAVALKWDKRLPRPLALARLTLKLQGALRGRSSLVGAALLGLCTPLLPCGPLYFLLAMAALSGSAASGVEFMVSFGLGTLPLLWIVQANFGWMRSRWSPQAIARVQAGLALMAAIVISWRLRSTLGFHGPSPTEWICF